MWLKCLSVKLLFFFLLLAGFGIANAGARPTALAFYYGANPPWGELQAFDVVVVDPGHVPEPQTVAAPHTRLVAYVALGEVQPSRPYSAGIPAAWLVGENKDWGSRVIDQARPEWQAFFVDNVIAPLWQKGYRSFFLDTLDSYHLVAKTPEARALQEAGMVATIELLKQRFPEAKLIFNRGFEILPKVHRHVEMVVAESLFQGYNAGKQVYTEVSASDREWLLGQLQRAQKDYQLAAAAIDYVPAANRELARKTAQRIQDLGLLAWVATPDLASVGVGNIEVMPRKVLIIHSKVQSEYHLRWAEAVRIGSLPLNYLGYAPEFVDIDHLPQAILVGRYAGVVVWLDDHVAPAEQSKLSEWLMPQVRDKLPLALVKAPDFLLQGDIGKLLGIRWGNSDNIGNPMPKIVQQSPIMGFETQVRADLAAFMAISPADGEPLLTIQRGEHKEVGAAFTPWGGYVLDSFFAIVLPGQNGDRWVIDPFAFFKKALRLPDMPVPDVTTETGRRMLMIHMDGDGFVSRSELPGNPFAGEVVLQRVAKKYPLPMTLSVIEAELSPTGLYPSLSKEAEKIAREIYKLPNVAMASHSYSHPFVWRKASTSDDTSGYNLRLPGYQFNLEREVTGSIRYIETRLAPPGKKVEAFLWTGDCIPGNDAVQAVKNAGVINMNGGDSVATRSNPSLTQIEGFGVPRASGMHVYAPNQNENVYTNNWTGPFYGFDRVIETFELTETPRRLKPINIYFHTYITTKAGGMRSLDKVFDYALAQETTPVQIADYARKVEDFQNLSIAKTASGWRIRGTGHLRTLRIPNRLGQPQLAASEAVAGFSEGKEESYVHLSGNWAELALGSVRSTQPRLVSANARIDQFTQSAKNLQWHLKGYVPLKFRLADVEGCQIRIAGRAINPTKTAGPFSDFEVKTHVAIPLEAICR